MKQPLFAGVSAVPFAHLLGLGAKAKTRAEDDDDKDRDDAARAEGDDDTDDDDTSAEGEDDGDADDKKDGKKGKKAKAKAESDDEDDDDADKREAAGRRAGIRAERKRWADVLGSEASASSAHHLATACTMLAETGLNARSIVATLGKLPAVAPAKTGRRSLDERMGAVKVPHVGGEGGDGPTPGSATATAQAVLAAGRKRRGEA